MRGVLCIQSFITSSRHCVFIMCCFLMQKNLAMAGQRSSLHTDALWHLFSCMSSPENAKFAGPSDRRGYFLSGSGKHPSITGPCDRLIVHCSPFLPHACAKLHLQWVCQKASGSAKNLVSAGPVVWHIKKSFRILCISLCSSLKLTQNLQLLHFLWHKLDIGHVVQLYVHPSPYLEAMTKELLLARNIASMCVCFPLSGGRANDRTSSLHQQELPPHSQRYHSRKVCTAEIP